MQDTKKPEPAREPLGPRTPDGEAIKSMAIDAVNAITRRVGMSVDLSLAVHDQVEAALNRAIVRERKRARDLCRTYAAAAARQLQVLTGKDAAGELGEQGPALMLKAASDSQLAVLLATIIDLRPDHCQRCLDQQTVASALAGVGGQPVQVPCPLCAQGPIGLTS